MPAPYGLLDTGFSYKTLDEILTDVEADELAQFGPIDTDPESNFGQYNGIQAERISDPWQLLRAIHAGLDPDTATGRMLENMLALVGVTRLPATNSKVMERFFGTNGTFVATGKSVQIPNGEKFTTTTTGTVGDVVSGYVDIECTADNTGPILALANTVTQLNSPIAGIASVNNPADQFFLGTDLESFPRMRARRLASIQALGTDQIATIRAKLLNLTGVTDVYVYENFSDVTDSSGVPAHSFEPVVVGGTPADIVAVIAKYRPMGIISYGNNNANSVIDSQGTSYIVPFSTENNKPIYITLNIIYDGNYPVDGDTLLKEAIVAWGQSNLHLGREVVASQIIPTIYSIPGIVDSGLPLIGLTPGPTLSTTLIMDNRDLATFSSLNIVINKTFGSFS